MTPLLHPGLGFSFATTLGTLLLTAGHNLYNEKTRREVNCVYVKFPSQRVVEVSFEDLWLDVDQENSDGSIKLGIDIGAINVPWGKLPFDDDDGFDVFFWDTKPEDYSTFIAGYPSPQPPNAVDWMFNFPWTWLLFLRNKVDYAKRLLVKCKGKWEDWFWP